MKKKKTTGQNEICPPIIFKTLVFKVGKKTRNLFFSWKKFPGVLKKNLELAPPCLKNKKKYFPKAEGKKNLGQKRKKKKFPP